MIEEEVHLQHAIAAQQHSAPVGCTQALCWSPVLIFSEIQALFNLQTSSKVRNRAILDLRTGVAPARKPCDLRAQPCPQYVSSRGTCAERSSIRRRDRLDLAPAQIKQYLSIQCATRKDILQPISDQASCKVTVATTQICPAFKAPAPVGCTQALREG